MHYSTSCCHPLFQKTNVRLIYTSKYQMTEDTPFTSSSSSAELVNHACKTSRDLNSTSICSKILQMPGFVDKFTGQDFKCWQLQAHRITNTYGNCSICTLRPSPQCLGTFYKQVHACWKSQPKVTCTSPASSFPLWPMKSWWVNAPCGNLWTLISTLNTQRKLETSYVGYKVWGWSLPNLAIKLQD